MKVGPNLLLPHRHPLFWLLVASGLTALFLWESDGFAPERDPDTVSYEYTVLPQHSEHDEDLQGKELLLALAGTRTLLFPAFLELVAPLTPDYALLPRIHWALFTLAVLYFWYATAAFSRSRWFAFSVAVPLAFPCWIPYVNWVMPEALAATFALMAVASLLLLARRPSSPLAWIGLTAATLLAYHAKPVFQFLVVLLPVLALVLRLSLKPRCPSFPGRWLLGIATATVLPLLLFCTLRWAVVGQFGLVSFNGYNLVGIAANLLDDEVVASLPEEDRPLAELIRQRRRFMPRASMDLFREHYVDNQWDIAEPAARQIVVSEISSGRTPEAALEPINLVIDRKLASLSVHVLRKRLPAYWRWVRSGFFYGLEQIPNCNPLRWLVVALLATVPVAGLVHWLRRRNGAPRAAPEDTARIPHGVALGGIALVAASFYLASLVLIVLVSWPMERYLDAASLMLPSAVSGAIFTLWALALRGVGTGSWRTARRWGAAQPRLETAGLVVIALAVGGWWLADRHSPAVRADWIWVNPTSPAGSPVGFFAVRDLHLPSRASHARLLVQADEEYRLFVNSVLVGSDRRTHAHRLDTYEVGDLLTEGQNRVAAELRSSGGEGGFLCRLDVSLPGRKRRTFVSDRAWRITRSLRPRNLRPATQLDEPTEPVVVSSRRRWGLRAGTRRPRFDEVLSTPATIAPLRFRNELQGGGWQEFDPAAGSRGTRVTFDWGREVTGYLNLQSREAQAALVYTGLEPPDPRVDRAQALVQRFSGGQPWTDVLPRRFRYVTVVSTVRVTGAWIDAVKPEWAETLLAQGETTGPEAPSSPALEELFRKIQRDGLAGPARLPGRSSL